jgi:hypothetical protein
MQLARRFFILSIFGSGFIFGASGAGSGGGGGTGVTPAGSGEVRTLSEKVPAGGTVQVKYLLTQPRPITGGAARFSLNGFSVDGVSLSNPLGDTAGAAVAINGELTISIISPSSTFGTNLDYPFLTTTMDIPASTPTGSTFPLGVSGATFLTPTGPLTLTDPKPGVLTIGGSVSVRGVYPGGGTQPAGTVISVRGQGFQPGTKLITKMKISSPVYISSTEMRFSLQQTVAMDAQPIQVSNPDGSQVIFYSYLKGAPVYTPTRGLLQKTEPIFQTLTHGVATVGPLPASADGDFVALAVQNPTLGPVVVTFQLQSTGATSTVLLPSGGRVMDELSALVGGVVPAGDVVTVTATSGVQILGIYGSDARGEVIPFLPAF